MRWFQSPRFSIGGKDTVFMERAVWAGVTGFPLSGSY